MAGTAPSYAAYYRRLIHDSGMSVARGAAIPFLRRDVFETGAYEMSYPSSSYAPWHADAEFQTVYAAVHRSTLVDIARLYELWMLVRELAGVPGAILEVGVWRGGSGALMTARARALGIHDRVYLCDTWEGVVKTGAHDPYYYDGKHDDASRMWVEQLVTKLGLSDVELLQGIFPEDTAVAIPDGPLRLCHIDVDVYQSAADVFAWAWPRLSPRGVVVFDDYGFTSTSGVAEFVDQQRGLDDRLVIHNLNGHGLIVKF